MTLATRQREEDGGSGAPNTHHARDNSISDQVKHGERYADGGDAMDARRQRYKVAMATFRGSLLDFYTEYAPAKAHKVSAIMKQFRGREHKIVAGILKKYNVQLRGVTKTLLGILAGYKTTSTAAPASISSSLTKVKTTRPDASDSRQQGSKGADPWAAKSPRVVAAARKSATRHTPGSGTGTMTSGPETEHSDRRVATSSSTSTKTTSSTTQNGNVDTNRAKRGTATAAANSESMTPSPMTVVTGPSDRALSRKKNRLLSNQHNDAQTASRNQQRKQSGPPAVQAQPQRVSPKKTVAASSSSSTTTAAAATTTKTSRKATTKAGGGEGNSSPRAPSRSPKRRSSAGGGGGEAPTTTTKEEKPVSVSFKPELTNRGAIKVQGYAELRYIGRGKFATAYRAIRTSDGHPVALKHIHGYANLKEKQKRRQRQEIKFLQQLKHPNIVHYYDSFKHEGSLIIVCEWAAAGDLKRQIQKIVAKGKYLSELNVWKYFHQIASAVQYMHHRRILHRDLKPANILLTAEGQIKVTDFGLSRGVSDNTVAIYSKVGTPLYMAPEVIVGKGYGWESDIWSLGCILYELANLKNPFREKGLDLKGLFRKVCRAEVPPMVTATVKDGSQPSDRPPPERYSANMKKLIMKLLQKDPKLRPSIDDVVEFSRKLMTLFAQQRSGRSRGGAHSSNGPAPGTAGSVAAPAKKTTSATGTVSSTAGAASTKDADGTRRQSAAAFIVSTAAEKGVVPRTSPLKQVVSAAAVAKKLASPKKRGSNAGTGTGGGATSSSGPVAAVVDGLRDLTISGAVSPSRRPSGGAAAAKSKSRAVVASPKPRHSSLSRGKALNEQPSGYSDDSFDSVTE